MTQQVFEWTPGKGPDAAALARLKAAFQRPDEPMGEAWFMGDTRKMYTDLLGDLEQMDIDCIHDALVEIGSGTVCFGHLEEWTDWYLYLLPRVLHRAQEGLPWRLGEYLVTGFLALFPSQRGTEPYAGFRSDVLMTLGQSMMSPPLWHDGHIVRSDILHDDIRHRSIPGVWGHVSGDLSASLFLCLKHLPDDQIPPWTRSLLIIDDAHWQAQLMAWLVGANAFLREQEDDIEDGDIEIHWAWSHCLKDTHENDLLNQKIGGKFISPINKKQFLATLTDTVSADTLHSWLNNIRQHEHLVTDMGSIPQQFRQLYLQESSS